MQGAGHNYDPSLYNEDLAPTKESDRTWNHMHIAALWVGMAVCIPTYGLAAGLVAAGASLGLAVTAVAIGNLIVLIPLILNGHPGAKYGIPFPVLIRASFGPVGAHIPTMIRALVACGWFGIQTWIGGKALAFLAATAFPSVSLPQFLPGFFGIDTGELLAFLVFWAMNVAIIIRGIDALKVFETLAAPFLLLTGLALFVWAWIKVPGGFGAMMTDQSPKLANAPTMSTFDALALGITIAVAFWGTLALNIPDFTRYVRSQRDQAIGQAISLPTTMTFYVFIGAAVTNATILIFHRRITDPVEVLSEMGGPAVVIFAMLGLIVATLSTNLAANVVSPANGFANLLPRSINFRRGAMITAVIGLVIFPWKMWESSAAYISAWLGGCGGLLGAVGGIMIADYFLLRKTELDVEDLYRRGGRYEFSRGINTIGVSALLIGIAPLIPGFLASIGVRAHLFTFRFSEPGALEAFAPGSFLLDLYKWSWFVGFLLAGAVYFAGMKTLDKK